MASKLVVSATNYFRTPKISLLAITIVLLAVGIPSVESCSRSRVYLRNNEYHNVVIAINENVPEDPQLIERIKEVFTDASGFLFEATRYRAFFKEISILVPKSWDDKPEYNLPEFESYDKGDVIIDYPDQETGMGNRPYVINPTPCGEIGQYMHLTPQYVLDPNTATKYGPYEKVIVHEWAHLRWGVYDEYPTPYSGQHFYAGPEGKIEATRCSAAVTGRRITVTGGDCEIGENNLPEEDCRFLDDRNDDGYTGSLMYKQFLPNIIHFCDNETFAESPGSLHNREAPNKQNQMCDGKSVWEVLREHGDFESGFNEPREIGSTRPNFRLVKQQNKRTVLVMDMSGSMDNNDRIEKLGQAITQYFQNTVDDGELVGMVVFSEHAQIKSQLVSINNDSRLELLSHIPVRDDVGGWTSIGSGLLKGLEVLEEGGQVAGGGVMLVISDGEENRPPSIEDVMPTIIAKNVTVDSIAFGVDASDNLELLPAATDGQAYFYSEDTNSNALNEAFTSNAQRDKSITERLIQLYSNRELVGTEYVFDVYIDSTIGKRTEFTFDYLGNRAVDVSLTQPDGIVIDSQSDHYELDETFKIIRIKIPGLAHVGKWTVSIQNSQQGEQPVSVNIQSRSRQTDVYPILVTSEWSSQTVTPPDKQTLYVSVSKGYSPILNAEVKAIVERPNNQPTELMMLDNGAGADVTKDDGIYSSYFTDFSGADRYNVKVTVNNKDSATIISPSRIVGVGALNDPTFDFPSSSPDRPSGNFQRVTSGGSFTCEGDACSVTSDLYPPAKIMDLMVTRVSYETKQVTLQFTAPGDNLDQGRANGYEIWMDIRFDAMYYDYRSSSKLTQSMMKMGILSSPKSAGSVEEFTFEVPSRGETSFVFTIVAIDDTGNRSPRSNIVSASMRDFSVSTLPFSLPILIVIVAGGVVLLIATIIIIVICCKCCCRGQKSDPEKQRERKVNKKRRSDKVAMVGKEAITTDEVVIVYNNRNETAQTPITKGSVAAMAAQFQPSNQNGNSASKENVKVKNERKPNVKNQPKLEIKDKAEPKVQIQPTEPKRKFSLTPADNTPVPYNVPIKKGRVSDLKAQFET